VIYDVIYSSDSNSEAIISLWSWLFI